MKTLEKSSIVGLVVVLMIVVASLGSDPGATGVIIALIPLYFTPSFVGWDKRNGGAIFVLNLFLGWTFVGWVVALVWACCVDREDPKTLSSETIQRCSTSNEKEIE